MNNFDMRTVLIIPGHVSHGKRNTVKVCEQPQTETANPVIMGKQLELYGGTDTFDTNKQIHT